MKEKYKDQKLRPCHLLKNRYLTGDLLCEGEHSRIYRAYDTALDQEVILKEFTGADSDTGYYQLLLQKGHKKMTFKFL